MPNWTPEIQELKTPGFIEYQKKCVEACIARMGEGNRDFFEGCTFEGQFTEEGGPRDPVEVAEDEYDALT